jgi:hypothetical protein
MNDRKCEWVRFDILAHRLKAIQEFGTQPWLPFFVPSNMRPQCPPPQQAGP